MKREGNADKRRVISPHSVSTALNAQWVAGLWKSTSFLLFVVTASHVNDLFGKNNLINISCSQRVGDYRPDEGLSACLPLLPNRLWVCHVTINVCRSHEMGGDAKIQYIKHKVTRYMKQLFCVGVIADDLNVHFMWTYTASPLSSACRTMIQVASKIYRFRYLSGWPV